MVDAAFANLDMPKVWARANARNSGSIRVMDKLGVRRGGLIRLSRRFWGPGGSHADPTGYSDWAAGVARSDSRAASPFLPSDYPRQGFRGGCSEDRHVRSRSSSHRSIARWPRSLIT